MGATTPVTTSTGTAQATTSRSGARSLSRSNKPAETPTTPPVEDKAKASTSTMPEITLAMIEGIRDELTKAKTREEVQAWWKQHFGQFGHKRLGRLMVNPDGDLTKLVRG